MAREPLAGLGVGGLLASAVRPAPQQRTISGPLRTSTLALNAQPSQIPLRFRGRREKSQPAGKCVGDAEALVGSRDCFMGYRDERNTCII